MTELWHNHPLIIAHRGRTAGGAAADNTVAAFEEAIAAGADMVECDVRRGADGELRLSHDALATGSTAVRLDEVVERLAGRVRLAVELKEPGYEEQVLAVIRRTFRADQFGVASFHDGVVARVKELAPDVQVGLYVGFPNTAAALRNPLKDVGLAARMRRTRADFIVCHQLLAGLGVLRWAATRGIPVVIWGVRSRRQQMKFMKDIRVVGVVTDAAEPVS